MINKLKRHGPMMDSDESYNAKEDLYDIDDGELEPDWITNLHDHFPHIEEGFENVDDFVAEMRTIEKA